MAFFYSSVQFNLEDGGTILFWSDPWLDRKRISEIAPDLLDVVPVRCRRRCSVAAALNGMSWVRDIKGALTIPALMQYVFLYQRLQSVHLEPGMREWLRWRWSADGIYSSRSVYATLLLGQASVLGAKELWKTKAPNSRRFFIWLVLLGRCWTNERRF
jgi:hypothetical protein